MKKATLAVLVAAAAVLLLPDPPGVAEPASPLAGLEFAAASLRGEGPRSDFAADYVAARALVRDDSAYRVLGPAFAEIGLSWDVEHRSTHPPTTALFALPVAMLSWPWASAIWTLLMIGTLVLAVWAFGVAPVRALPIALLALVWPPAAWSLGQLTPIWVAGLALAWRWRASAGLAGAVLGAAALTKFFPLLLLVPFVLRRQFRAVAAAAAIGAAAVAFVALLSPASLVEYVELGRQASAEEIHRLDNGAFAPAALHLFGLAGGVFAVGAIVVAAAVGMRRRAGEISWGEWSAWNWVSVACLPIAWIYSLLPLAPALVGAARFGRRWRRGFALAALLLPAATAPFGVIAALVVSCAVACAGLATVVAAPRLRGELVPAPAPAE